MFQRKQFCKNKGIGVQQDFDKRHWKYYRHTCAGPENKDEF